MWEEICSTFHSNVPYGLLPERLPSRTQIMFILLWERRLGNKSGKACFLVSVPTLWAWEHINNSSYSGAQQVQETLNTLWRLLKHVRWGKGAKEPGRSFLLRVYLSHTGTSLTQVTHGAGTKLITCFQKEAASVSSSFQYVSEHEAKCSLWSPNGLKSSYLRDDVCLWITAKFPASSIFSLQNRRKVDRSTASWLST